jgi:hypothetical protein
MTQKNTLERFRQFGEIFEEFLVKNSTKFINGLNVKPSTQER